MREPKMMGTGIFVHQQFIGREKDLVRGDSFFDADYGLCFWSGMDWVTSTEITRQIERKRAKIKP